MRVSRYNIFVPCKKGIAAYNTLHGSILLMDEEMREVLEKEKLDTLTEKDSTALEKAGFITDMDEKKVLSLQLKSLIYSPNTASFSILPTYACNLQCPYCYEGSGNIRREVMSEDMVNQVIQGMKAFCSETGAHQVGITLYGGEPLLHKKASLHIVTAMGEWAQDTGATYTCSMITNGTLLTGDVVEEFGPSLKMIQVTLDGPKEYHDTRRIQKTGEGTYESIMNAVEIARDHGILVMVRIQVAKDNVSMLGDLFTDFRERGFNKDEGIKAYLFPLMEINEVCSSYASLCSEKEARMLPLLWRKAREYGLELVGKPVQIVVSPYCSFAAKNSFLIDPLGDVYKCVSVVGDPLYKVGHMSEKGLTDMTPELYRFTVRSPADITMCSDCVLLPLCGGGCAHRAYQKHGTYQAGDCTLHKGLEEEKLLLYLGSHYPDWFR
ncbi:MAG: radical SAM protein [Theionarchaea archaeon]|nr:radical SAM protein [Theionarchaea archaeon]MBU7022320.1 radical SAM protein [Theionarchaea archaeon]